MENAISTLRKEAKSKSSQPVMLTRKMIRDIVKCLNANDDAFRACEHALNTSYCFAQYVKSESVLKDAPCAVKRADTLIYEIIKATEDLHDYNG